MRNLGGCPGHVKAETADSQKPRIGGTTMMQKRYGQANVTKAPILAQEDRPDGARGARESGGSGARGRGVPERGGGWPAKEQRPPTPERGGGRGMELEL